MLANQKMEAFKVDIASLIRDFTVQNLGLTIGYLILVLLSTLLDVIVVSKVVALLQKHISDACAKLTKTVMVALAVVLVVCLVVNYVTDFMENIMFPKFVAFAEASMAKLILERNKVSPEALEANIYRQMMQRTSSSAAHVYQQMLYVIIPSVVVLFVLLGFSFWTDMRFGLIFTALVVVGAGTIFAAKDTVLSRAQQQESKTKAAEWYAFDVMQNINLVASKNMTHQEVDNIKNMLDAVQKDKTEYLQRIENLGYLVKLVSYAGIFAVLWLAICDFQTDLQEHQKHSNQTSSHQASSHQASSHQSSSHQSSSHQSSSHQPSSHQASSHQASSHHASSPQDSNHQASNLCSPRSTDKASNRVLMILSVILGVRFQLHALTKSQIGTVDSLGKYNHVADKIKTLSETIVHAGTVQKNLDASLVFSNIWFVMYPQQHTTTSTSTNSTNSNSKWLLKDLNLRVEPFTTVVVKGKSGSGKSTLANMCVRIKDPTRGKIEIGKVDVQSYAIDALRKVVALVNPDQGLLNRTIGENILFGASPTDMDVKQRAGAIFADFYQVFVGKTLDSDVGNNGSKLSTGQKMLVKLMNLLVVGDAPFMIFDEPTSGLDAQTKAFTLKMIDTLKKTRKHTILIITHDEDCAQLADKTYELANSVLVAR